MDRKNKNNQKLFEGTFEAMKAGGAIALFPEGGSYTIPKLAKLKMGAAWAALEYSRYLEQEGGQGKVKTGVQIVPAAVVFDDKSVFRSRGMLRFGEAIRLDGYIEEFLSSPPPPADGAEKEGGAKTVPPAPQNLASAPMTRANTEEEKFASPAHRAVARLTSDLQRAMEALCFNAENWEIFQSTRAARELIFELTPGGKEAREGIEEYVDLSRCLSSLLTQSTPQSTKARQALFTYNSLLHLCNVDNFTLARTTSSNPTTFWTSLKSLLIRLPYYIPIFGPTLIPTYILPNALAHHYAGREEESLSAVKVLFSVLFSSILYTGLVVETMRWARWSPPGLLVGLAGVWLLHDLNRGCVDGALGLVKDVRFNWRVWRAGVRPGEFKGRLKEEERMGEEGGRSLFFYGTLVHPKILARVIGNNGSHLSVQNAVLDGAKLFHVKGEEYPGLQLHPNSCVKGTLVTGLTPSDIRCLDAFEGNEYSRVSTSSVFTDPSCRVESNSTRITNAGSAPLHTILATLTKSRMEQLVKEGRGKEVKGVEVYSWVAGKHRLEDRVWEFDLFAKEKAHNWVGEGQVEHEHEYQVVDSIRTEGITTTATLTRTPPRPASPLTPQEDDSWIDTLAMKLVPEAKGNPVKKAIIAVCKQLREKPSIQHFVNKTFPTEAGIRRPRLGDRHLLTALYIAREEARGRLEELIQSLGGEREEVGLLVSAKGRALALVGVKMEQEGAGWPFSPAQLRGWGEDRKTV